MSKTQNLVEEWHQRLKCLLGKRATDLGSLMCNLMCEQSQVDDMHLALSSAVLFSPLHWTQSVHEEALDMIMRASSQYSVLEYLTAISTLKKAPPKALSVGGQLV